MSGIKSSSNFIGSLSSFAASASGAFSPRDIPNLALWLDGNDPAGTGVKPANGASVATWVDKSGNGIDFTQASGANQPTFVSTYYIDLGSLLFDGADDFFGAAYNALINTHDTAIFISLACNNASATWGTPLVTRQANGGGDVFGYNFYKTAFNDPSNGNKWQVWLGSNAPGFNQVVGPVMTLNKRSLLSFGASGGAGGNAQFVVDGSLIGSANYYSEIDGGVTSIARVGALAPAAATFYFPGYISEVIVYSDDLTAMQYAQVQNYLISRWGI